MAIGGLWVPRETKQELTRQFRQVCHDAGLHSEIKWSKVSRKYLDAYKRLVDFFAEHESLRFRSIVVEQEKLDLDKYHGGDRELGFYKFYYQMLIKWIEQGNEYLILLDYKRNKGADRYTTLRTYLERKVKGEAWVTDLTVVDSHQSPLCQLADLMTGAVAASWCGIPEDSPKAKLAEYIAMKCGMRTLKSESPSPDVCKFNIFRIRL